MPGEPVKQATADETAAVVLNVDDNDAGRYATSRILRRAGFEVREAATGGECLRLAGGGADLVVLDVNLPDISGFEVCRLLKADPATAHMPVLHLSATYVRGEDRTAGLQGGADGYLTQPVEPAELVATVHALLRVRRAEAEVRRAASEWQATFDAIGEGIGVLDGAGRLVRANRALVETLGGEGGVLGRTCAQLVGSDADCPCERARATRARVTAERRIGDRWLELAVDPVTDAAGEIAGGVLVVRDLSERVAAEQRLAESERRYRDLFDAQPLPLWVYDLETTRFLAANEAATREYGWSHEEFLTLTLEDIRPASEVKALRESVAASRRQAGFEYSGPWRHRTRDGSEREVEIVSHDVAFQGRPARVVAVVDITLRRSLEEQLRHSQKMDAIGRLAGGVAHDFNNLLQAMLATVQLVRLRDDDPASRHALLSELETLVRGGAGLTRQLLLFSRRDVPRSEPLDVNQVVTGASRMLRRIVRENIRFRVVLAAAPLGVKADRGQLEQVLVNLVVNASDAMPHGGELTVRTAAGTDGEAWVEVVDTGCGIAPELCEKIFEPFFTTKPPGQGTGLGLAVVHGIVTSFGGRVEVESRPGAGSRFRIVLPGFGEPPAPAEATPSAFHELRRGDGLRVVLVEDEEWARVGLAEMLRALGYEVLDAASGEDAEALAASSSPHLLLTDVMLPGIDGPTLAARLVERWPALRVVLMSGYTEDVALRERLAAPGTHFIVKPFDIATLARELHAAMAGDAPEP